MSNGAELRPPAPPDETGGAPHSLVLDVWASISSDEFGARVLVAAAVVVAIGWLGVKAAVAAVIVSQLLTEAVKELIRRREPSRRRMWLMTLLLLLLDFAHRAWARVCRTLHLPHRSAPPTGWWAATTMAVAVSAFTVIAFTVPEVALGHSLVGERRWTFFGDHRVQASHLSVPPVVVVVGRKPGAPDLTVPRGPRKVEAKGPWGARVVYTATSKRGRVKCAPRSGSAFSLGATRVRCTARTSEGATTQGGFLVIVVDRLAPTLDVPRSILRDVFSAPAPISFRVVAHDRVDGAVRAVCLPKSGASFGLGKTKVSCTAADRRGHRASASFLVVLNRVPAGSPVFNLPAGRLVEATGPAGATVHYRASARTGSGRSLAIRCSPRSGQTFPIGTSPVSCTATAPTGQESHATFSVTVRDHTPPTLKLEAPSRVEADSRSGALVAYVATAIDLVSGKLRPTCAPRSGRLLSIGSHRIACSATDRAGNQVGRHFTVVVFDGPPVLAVPADVSMPYTSVRGTVVTYSATATDKVDGDLTPTCDPRSQSRFQVGSTRVTCSVTDSAGNPVNKQFTVTILDRVPPNLTVPADFTRWAPFGASTFNVSFSASAVDAIDGQVSVECNPASGSAFPVGRTTPVSCRAVDRSNNVAEGSFRVTVWETPGLGERNENKGALRRPYR